MTSYFAATPEEAVRQMGERLLQRPLVAPRGIETREELNVEVFVTAPWMVPYELPGRALHQVIGAFEALQLVGQTTRPELAPYVSKNLGEFREDHTYHGPYGQRAYRQLDKVVRLLERDPDSRRAVITIYDHAMDLDADSKDIPCTVSLQFFVREGKLLLRTSMRSNDVWLGMPYDLVQFASLQGAVASALGLRMGGLSHNVGSMHLYERDVPAVEKMSRSTPTSRPDRFKFFDRMWSVGTIGDISSRARRILDGKKLVPATPHELWLYQQMQPVIKKWSKD